MGTKTLVLTVVSYRASYERYGDMTSRIITYHTTTVKAVQKFLGMLKKKTVNLPARERIFEPSAGDERRGVGRLLSGMYQEMNVVWSLTPDQTLEETDITAKICHRRRNVDLLNIGRLE